MTAEPELVTDLVAAADRLDGLGDTAELMGDEGGAHRFRHQAAALRTKAMALLDPE
ncbi:MAG TPA: hypothetical protein VFV32_05795 [Acidimicrobiales bacterium]|nr:hypothetical protein [Acidimicrobiales bacterium]